MQQGPTSFRRHEYGFGCSLYLDLAVIGFRQAQEIFAGVSERGYRPALGRYDRFQEFHCPRHCCLSAAFGYRSRKSYGLRFFNRFEVLPRYQIIQ
jgi:hypothetical protein